MKKNLEIIDYEDKKSQAGKRYTRFKTNDGWMSCFDKKECDLLKLKEGQEVSVEVIQSGDFKNIQKCYGEARDDTDDADEVEVDKIPGGEAKAINKYDAMYTSYAKDIFCKLMEYAKVTDEGIADREMKRAIELVKQAKEAFE